MAEFDLYRAYRLECYWLFRQWRSRCRKEQEEIRKLAQVSQWLKLRLADLKEQEYLLTAIIMRIHEIIAHAYMEDTEKWLAEEALSQSSSLDVTDVA